MPRSLRHYVALPVSIRELDVLRVSDVTPGMRRVTLGGDGLKAHLAENGFPVGDFRSDGFDDDIRIVLTSPGLDAPVLPTQGDGRVVWPRDPRLETRAYTVRRFDPVAGEVDVDFVRHGVGLATAWAMRARPGQTVHIAGPSASGGHPQDVDWVLVLGDETALPAIGRWLENWPAEARGKVFIEVAEDAHRQELPVPDGVELTWLSRDGAAPGTTTLLFDAIRTTNWWPGRVFAWAARESSTLTPIRRWLRNDKQLPKEAVDVAGYWRRSAVVTSGTDPSVPVEDEGDEILEAIDSLTDLAGGFAVRVAVTTGMLEALAAGPLTPEQIAGATGCHPGGIGHLVRYLAAAGILDERDGKYSLSGMGAALSDEYAPEEYDLDGLSAQEELAGLLALLSAVRTGHGDHHRWFGAAWDDHVAAVPALTRARVEAAEEEADYYCTTLAADESLTGVGRLLLTGPEAGEVSRALVDAHPGMRVTVLASPSEIEVITSLHPAHERIVFAAGSQLAMPRESFDAVLLNGTLDREADADVVHVLAGAAASARKVLVVLGETAMEDEEQETYELARALVDFGLNRAAIRTDAQWRDLFRRTGLKDVGRSNLGWGMMLHQLTK